VGGELGESVSSTACVGWLVGGSVPFIVGAEEIVVAILGEDDGGELPVGAAEMVGACDTKKQVNRETI
jgi:hypothetical protein